MKINKQLFEDVLSGKLKGTFVLRDQFTCNSDELTRNTGKYKAEQPYNVKNWSYSPSGTYYFNSESNVDIVDFIPDTDMKENELTIEIPDGKIVDWEESKKQNKIVLKNKQLTYEDICKKLFGNYAYYIDTYANIKSSYAGHITTAPNNAPTAHQLECILAKNKLANVAKYLNDGWKPEKSSYMYVINNYHGNLVVYTYKEECSVRNGQVIFKTEELAHQAIKILGEETVKLALEPLGI